MTYPPKEYEFLFDKKDINNSLDKTPVDYSKNV